MSDQKKLDEVMNLLILTQLNGEEVIVNLNHVIYIESVITATRLHLAGGKEIDVKEQFSQFIDSTVFESTNGNR